MKWKITTRNRNVVQNTKGYFFFLCYFKNVAQLCSLKDISFHAWIKFYIWTKFYVIFQIRHVTALFTILQKIYQLIWKILLDTYFSFFFLSQENYRLILTIKLKNTLRETRLVWYRVAKGIVNFAVTTYDKQEHNSWLIRTKTLYRQERGSGKLAKLEASSKLTI